MAACPLSIRRLLLLLAEMEEMVDRLFRKARGSCRPGQCGLKMGYTVMHYVLMAASVFTLTAFLVGLLGLYLRSRHLSLLCCRRRTPRKIIHVKPISQSGEEINLDS